MMQSKNLMKAIVLLGPDDFELQHIPVPEPEADEVLCKIHAVAICGSDPKFIHGDMKGIWPPYYPFVIGHEWAGEVVELGSAVKSLRIGQRVSGEAHAGCGVCEMCKSGRYNLCLNYGRKEKGHRHYGHNSTGSYAQYGVFKERSLTMIPESVPYDQASIIDAAGTGLHAIERTGITPGGTVAIFGPGPIGMVVGKVARLLGTSRVIMIGRGDRLKKSLETCADHVIDFEREPVVDRVRELTNGLGADVVFECSGAPGTIDQSLQVTRKGGKISLLGIPSPGTKTPIDDRKLILDEITLYGSRANPNVSGKLLAMIDTGKLDVSDLVTHHFPIDEFSEALDTFVHRKEGAIKVIIEPNRDC
jgi:L-iditol 2-dehydrogenase